MEKPTRWLPAFRKGRAGKGFFLGGCGGGDVTDPCGGGLSLRVPFSSAGSCQSRLRIAKLARGTHGKPSLNAPLGQISNVLSKNPTHSGHCGFFTLTQFGLSDVRFVRGS